MPPKKTQAIAKQPAVVVDKKQPTVILVNKQV